MSFQPTPIEVFYSYAHEDEPLRNELEKHLSILQRLGLISSWHDRQIIAGTDWAKVVDAHLETASLILLLVSSDFLASNYCYGVEMKRALGYHQMNEACVIPIMLRPVAWKGAPFEHLQTLPADGRPVTEWGNLDAAFRDIATGIQRVIENLPRSSASVSPVGMPPIWNIPYPRNPFFTGRDDLLKRIHDQLQAGQAMALSQAQAISGLGGIGKTQVAVEYAYRYRGEYEVILWALAGSRESLVSGYIALAKLLNLSEKDAKEQQIIIEAIKTWLQTHSSWLLILDNADDLKVVREFIPLTFGGHILLTTRAWTMGKLAKRLEVETMTVDIGALLLLRLVSLVERNASLDTASGSDLRIAREICEELGGLPLALDQAGAYIEETQCSLHDYQERYRTRWAQLLQWRGGLTLDHPEPVATTWSLSFEKVEKKSAAAADLLRVCAFLHPDAIPVELVTKGVTHLGPLLAKTSEDDLALDDAIATLSTYSLIRRNPLDKTLSIHRLVQAVLRDTMDDEMRKQWARRAVRSVNVLFPEVEFSAWLQCEQYLPHALSCAELVEQENIVFPEAGSLLNRAGWYLRERARYSEAELLTQQGLAIRQQCFEPMHHDIANSLRTLGYLYRTQGRFAEAEPVMLQALTIDETVLGSEDSEVATDLNNLAMLYHKQGRYEQARPLYQRALSIRSQKLGEMHPSTATTLNWLAMLYYEQGRYEQAGPLYQRALSIDEKAYGLVHPNVARDLYNLAMLYYAQGNYVEAEPFFRRALLIWRQTLGETHPDTQTVRQSYISLLRKTGRSNEAMALETQGQLPSEEH